MPHRSSSRRAADAIRRHACPPCAVSGEARYRDRAQARQAAEARRRAHGAPARMKPFIVHCTGGCEGFHVRSLALPFSGQEAAEPCHAFTASLAVRPRRFHVVDIENLAQGGASRRELAALWRAYTREAPGVAPGDHVVISAAHAALRHFAQGIDDPRVNWVAGADVPDGADRALLGAIDLRRVAKGFDEVVVASGDGIFASLARQARLLGLRVQVVTTENPGFPTLSRELAGAATTRTTIRRRSRTQLLANLAAVDLVHRASAA